MNNRHLTMFKMNQEQLEKELVRRGIHATFYRHLRPTYKSVTKEEAIAMIMWKDAYDSGYNDHMKNRCRNYWQDNVEVNTSAPSDDKFLYELVDVDNGDRELFLLTEKERNVIEYLYSSGYISEDYFSFRKVSGHIQPKEF